MNRNGGPTNVVIAGLGGQGVLKASGILADAAFRAGFDVKKSEIHGMSQRGGSVISHVRFGNAVFSPVIAEGEADFLVVLAQSEMDCSRHMLRPGGALLHPVLVENITLPDKKCLNIALLGLLSAALDLPEQAWVDAIRANLPESAHQTNLEAFRAGRESAAERRPR